MSLEKDITEIKALVEDGTNVKEGKVSRTAIRDFNGKIIAWIVCKDNGDQEITEFFGKILGRYVSSSNMTHDFYGKILGQGNILTTLIR